MISRPVAVALLAVGCLTAAAGGAYMSSQPQADAASPAAVAPSVPSAVSETEAVVTPAAEPATVTPDPVRVERTIVEAEPRRVPARPSAPAVARARDIERRGTPVARRDTPVAAAPLPVEPAVPASAPMSDPAPARSATPVEDPAPAPQTPPAPRVEELVVPAASVIGIEVETALSSERARLEDRVEARVARDVFSDGRLVIPAGSRVIGAVTTVERGGRVKERARLGLRFHTLVLADGRQTDFRTDTIYREGESPAGDSTKKIGGAAVGGAVLGAIMGGRKGAIAGGIAGAAGGTAVVMSGDRHAATLASGSVLNARLASPLTIEIERR